MLRLLSSFPLILLQYILHPSDRPLLRVRTLPHVHVLGFGYDFSIPELVRRHGQACLVAPVFRRPEDFVVELIVLRGGVFVDYRLGFDEALLPPSPSVVHVLRSPALGFPAPD